MNSVHHSSLRPLAGSQRDQPRERPGGPRRSPPVRPSGRSPDHGSVGSGSMLQAGVGSHMPLDTVLHWDWRNPLNLLPLSLVLALLLALVALLL